MDAERPSKRVKLLSDDDDSDQEPVSSNDASVKLGFNEEYARRFEHNKKREEQHRLQEKYGTTTRDGGDDTGSSEESTDEEEDEDADLAKGILDDEFQITLKALKNKDPRIYNKEHQFYSTDPDVPEPVDESRQREKPMHLSDYHRQRLLNGDIAGDDEGSLKPTYAQEQESLRKSFLRAAANEESSDKPGDGDDFLYQKRVVESESDMALGEHLTDDIRLKAKDDPDKFLATFMDSKGWRPSATSKLQAFESDDEDFDDVQDQFEHSYNMRFETQDTKGKIQTFSRDVTTQYSVRKEGQNKRQRARDAEKQQKSEEKQQRVEEKARLRKLKLEEAEEKLKMVKQAAGMQAEELDIDKWSSLLTGDWDDDEWRKKFEENFGEDYYAEQDSLSNSKEDADHSIAKKKKPKKPKFDDDIDITDLVPDFDEEQTFSITEDEMEDKTPGKKKKSKEAKKEREETKRAARKERRQLEALVDEKIDMDSAMTRASSGDKKQFAPFRYRETSPTSFGLTSTEILLASDSQLNSFVGLKKLAAFREEDKKKKDKKHLGKKARLRKWRQETFGSEQGPQKTLQDTIREGEE